MSDIEYLNRLIRQVENTIEFSKTYGSSVASYNEILKHLKGIRDKLKDFITYHDSDSTELTLKNLLTLTNSQQDIFLNVNYGRSFMIHESSSPILKDYEDYNVIYIQTDYDPITHLDSLIVVITKPTDD